ncbi:MAG: rRNA maturation RNase YbeY [Roseobacter sp.]
MEIDILIEDARWHEVALETLAQNAIVATCSHMGVSQDATEVSVLACDDVRIAVLNADFREKHQATNVLSWPSENLAAAVPGAEPSVPMPDMTGVLSLGDIAIAFETCAREAQELDKPLSEHITHLIVHGTLHLLGYDHIRDPDATLMQGIEAEILGKMGLNDPYRT